MTDDWCSFVYIVIWHKIYYLFKKFGEKALPVKTIPINQDIHTHTYDVRKEYTRKEKLIM